MAHSYERATNSKRIREAVTTGLAIVAASGALTSAADAKPIKKQTPITASAASASRAIYPQTLSECISAATGSSTQIEVNPKRPKRPQFEFKSDNTGTQCDGIAGAENVFARLTARVTLYERIKDKGGKAHYAPLGRVGLANAPLFPMPAGTKATDRDTEASGKMRLPAAMCEGDVDTYKLESAVTIRIEDGVPQPQQAERPTLLEPAAFSGPDVDTISPPVEGEVDLSRTIYSIEKFRC